MDETGPEWKVDCVGDKRKKNRSLAKGRTKLRITRGWVGRWWSRSCQELGYCSPNYCLKTGRELVEKRISQQGQTNFLVTFTGLLHKPVCVCVCVYWDVHSKLEHILFPSPSACRNQKGGKTWQISSGRIERSGENSTSNDLRASPASLPVWLTKIAAVWQLSRKRAHTHAHTHTNRHTHLHSFCTQVWKHFKFLHKYKEALLYCTLRTSQPSPKGQTQDASSTFLNEVMAHPTCKNFTAA